MSMIDILPVKGSELTELIHNYRQAEIMGIDESVLLRRYSKKICLSCQSQLVQYAEFNKCPDCVRGSDATLNWREFYINAKYKSAHLPRDLLIYHVFTHYHKHGKVKLN